MTNREAIYQIRRTLKEVNADSKMTNRHIYSILKKHSRLLIQRESDRLNLLKKRNIFKTLKCIDVVEAPAIDPCCGLRSKCTVWRTKDRVPKIYEDSYGAIIRGVKTVDGFTSLNLINPGDFERKLNNPWIPKNNLKKYYFYSDGYIYFPNGGYKKVQIEAFYEDDITGLSMCTASEDYKGLGKDCIGFLDQTFPLPDYLESRVFELTLQELSNTYERLVDKSAEINKNDNNPT